MKNERYGGRQVFSEGMEHVVLRPRSGNPNFLLKQSRWLNAFLMIGRDQAVILRQEFAESQSLLEGTGVAIPRTHIIKTKERKILGIPVRGYVMGQEYIRKDDNSIPDPREHLSRKGLTSLVDEHKHEPRNFIGNGGVLYWIDPTKGTIGRLLENTKIMKLETYRKVRVKLSKVIRFVGL